MLVLLDAYLIFAALLFLGLLALDINRALAGREPKRRKAGNYTPKTLVMVPCKGAEEHLDEDLRSLKNQNYGRYSLVAIVDSPGDGAVSTIRQIGIKVMVSGRTHKKASGKVRALLTAMDSHRNYDAYVIADSDATFGRDWLSRLLAPLADKRVGISTAFPFFEPEGGFWSRVKMVWGFVGESLMETKMTRFGWGGSLAFRKDLMDNRALKMMSESVADDIAITRTATSKGLGIVYVRGARVKIRSDDGFLRFAEWSTRQTALSIFGNGKVLRYGLVYYSAEILVFLTGAAGAFAISPLLAVMLLHAAASIRRNFERSGEMRLDTALITLLIPFVYLSNLIAASGVRSITWRGARYRLR